MKFYHAAAFAMLIGATSVAAQDKADTDAAKAEKPICKVEHMTGSLTRTTKTCKTKAEWDQATSDTKRYVDDLQNSNRTQAAAKGPFGG